MPTIITKTVGPTGRDYATLQQAGIAVDNVASAETGGTKNLVTSDIQIVFEVDAATYTDDLDVDFTGVTTDATRNVVFRPASGSEHQGDPSQGVQIDVSEKVGVRVNLSHTRIEGFVFKGGEVLVGSELGAFGDPCEGVIIDSCLADDGVVVDVGPSLVRFANETLARVEATSGSDWRFVSYKASYINGQTSLRDSAVDAFQETDLTTATTDLSSSVTAFNVYLNAYSNPNIVINAQARADLTELGTLQRDALLVAVDYINLSSPTKHRVQNCVFHEGSRLSTGCPQVVVANCTQIVASTETGTTYYHGTFRSVQYINCLTLPLAADANCWEGEGTQQVAPTGSNNFGGSSGSWPAGIQGSPYPITATTSTSPGAGDFAIYDATTGALVQSDENDILQAGVGTSNSLVPALDILGNARGSTTASPGAFEVAAAPPPPPPPPPPGSGRPPFIHANKLETQVPWIWLYELQTKDDPPQRYRLTSFTQSVQFGLNAAGQPLVYSPAPITHGDVEEGTDGSLPTISVTLGNAGPIVGATMDAADGFVGQPVRVLLVSAFDLESGKASVVQQGEVVSATVQQGTVSLQISAFNLYQLQFPPFIHSRRRCRWIFGSAECGYNTSLAGAGFTTCNKTLANCEERGDDEVAQGFERAHPARFGAFPGIPRAGL